MRKIAATAAAGVLAAGVFAGCDSSSTPEQSQLPKASEIIIPERGAPLRLPPDVTFAGLDSNGFVSVNSQNGDQSEAKVIGTADDSTRLHFSTFIKNVLGTGHSTYGKPSMSIVAFMANMPIENCAVLTRYPNTVAIDLLKPEDCRKFARLAFSDTILHEPHPYPEELLPNYKQTDPNQIIA